MSFDDYDNDDDFVSISASDALSDSGGYTADGDDFVALGTPLSYAHSLRCGLPESKALVYYVPASPIEEETEEDEEEYEDEAEEVDQQTQHLDADESASDAETYWDLSFTPTVMSCGTATTTNAATKEGSSSVKNQMPQLASTSSSTRTTPPRASMTVRLVDASEELHNRLEGRVVVPTRRTYGVNRKACRAELAAREAEDAAKARQLAQAQAEKDAPYHIVSKTRGCGVCSYRPPWDTRNCYYYRYYALGHAMPSRCCLSLWADERGTKAPWWAATMSRAPRAAPAGVVRLVSELAERGLLIPVWVLSGGDGDDDRAYWAMMDDTVKGLRELLVSGSLASRDTRDARRELERDLRTATLARILDCAPVDGEWCSGAGRLANSPDLRYQIAFHDLLTPNSARTSCLTGLRLALVLTSSVPCPPPTDDWDRAWLTLRAVKKVMPRMAWNGSWYRPYDETEWAPQGPKHFGHRMFLYELYAHLAADDSKLYRVGSSSP